MRAKTKDFGVYFTTVHEMNDKLNLTSWAEPIAPLIPGTEFSTRDSRRYRVALDGSVRRVAAEQ